MPLRDLCHKEGNLYDDATGRGMMSQSMTNKLIDT